MRARAFLLVCALVFLGLVIPAFAQEGHPLKGTWLGDWGPNKSDRNQVTIVMDWDGKQITGQINPGPGSIALKNATLDPNGWTVHFEADAKNAAGQPVHYVVDGKIENLGLYNRVIVGSWGHDNMKGDFRIQRQ